MLKKQMPSHAISISLEKLSNINFQEKHLNECKFKAGEIEHEPSQRLNAYFKKTDEHFD